MTVASLTNVSKRVVSILGANPGAFASTVSGDVGAFPDDAEIQLAILTADGELITRGYFQSINNTLSERFMAMSEPIAPSGNIPFHYGNTGKVEVSKSVATFLDANVNIATDQITIPGGHGLNTGDPTLFLTTGTLPDGLDLLVTYYAVVISPTVFSVASTYAFAMSNTIIDITSASGGGLHTVIGWKQGIKAESEADILNAQTVGNDYVESGAFDHLVLEKDGNLLHSATYARIEIPTYTRTSLLQADQADETSIVALAIKSLTKNASPAPFAQWTAIAEACIPAIIRDGSYQPEPPQDENP